jgi:hypothetical protein
MMNPFLHFQGMTGGYFAGPHELRCSGLAAVQIRIGHCFLPREGATAGLFHHAVASSGRSIALQFLSHCGQE